MSLVIGNMRYKIIVQKKVSTRDSYGSVSTIYEDYLNLKAEVKYGSGSKGINTNEIFTTNTIIFLTHYRPLTVDMQIVFEGQKYRINNLQEIGFKSGLQITTELINE